MPQKFFMKMKAVYLVDTGTLIKIFNALSMGSVNKFLERLFIYIEE